MPNLSFDKWSPNLSFGQSGWQNYGSNLGTSGGQTMSPTGLGTAAAISGASSIVGGLLSGAGKKKERKWREQMIKDERAFQERMQKTRWTEQTRRSKEALGRLAPKQGFIPTYQGLKEIAPLLKKLLGGNIAKYFGDKTSEQYGMQDILGRIAEPDYTGYEQEPSYTEQAPPQEEANLQQRVPEYFKQFFNQRKGMLEYRGRRDNNGIFRYD